MKFNEDSRVKLPAILTLVRMGYDYISLKNSKWDIETNIFPEIFIKSIKKINKDLNLQDNDIQMLLRELSNVLDYEDLGREFYKRLTSKSGLKLIDFENFDNNTFNVASELTYKNGDDEFRADTYEWSSCC